MAVIENMKDIAIYGAGGFGREIFCLLRRINSDVGCIWNIIGFFDDGLDIGFSNEYGSVVGNLETLNKWPEHLSVVFAIGNPKIVEYLFNRITNPNIDFPNILAPDLLLLDPNNVRMGKGNIFCSRCLVSCNVEIGDFNVFNGYVTIGHDAEIGNFNSIMPAVKISGGVKIGNRNFLGVSSVVLQYKNIGNDTVIGASSVVFRNNKEGGTNVGNPAKRIQY